MELKILWLSAFLMLTLAVKTTESQDFFDFMTHAMRFMGRMMGMDPMPETRAEPEPSRTAERIKALHDAAKFVSDARERAGKRVLKNRIERMRNSIGAGPSSSSADASSNSDDSLSSLLSDTESKSSDSTDLASLLSDTSDSSTSTGNTDLDALLKSVEARSSNRRQLNIVLAKLVKEKLKQKHK